MPKNLKYLKRNRLLHKAQYDAVFSEGHKIVTPYFVIFTCENDLDCARLGQIVSKKCAASATVRNRIKRIVRETFRHHLHELDRIDVVILARAGIANVSRKLLRKELDKRWIGLKKSPKT